MNSNRPVTPEGLDRDAVTLAVRDDEQGPSVRSSIPSTVLGAFWCSVGIALFPEASVLSSALVAFGAAVVLGGGTRRTQALALLIATAVGSVAASLLFGVRPLPMALVSTLVAYAIAWGYVRGHLGAGGLVLASAVLGCVGAGIDSTLASMQGGSITSLLTEAIDKVVEMNEATVDLDGMTAVLWAKDVFLAYWPTMYFVVGLANVLFALYGARTGARTMRVRDEDLMVRYDVPLWVVVVFALGVAIELLGPHLPAWQETSAMVGANVVMCARLALALQGIAVLRWWTKERGASTLARTVVVLAALWLELSFALASIAGLLDVAANFRSLERKRPSLIPGPAKER